MLRFPDPGTNFCYRLSRNQGHSAIGKIMSMKNSSGTIWNRTSVLPICSAAPYPLAPNDIYICRAVSPLNDLTAIKVAGGKWGFNSGTKDKIPAPKF